MPLLVVLSRLWIAGASRWVRLEQRIMQLPPLIDGASQRAEPSGDPTSPCIFSQVRRLCFDLVNHGFQLLAHLSSLPNAAWQLICGGGHLLHQISSNVFISQIFQCILGRSLSRLEEGSLHAWRHESKRGVQQPISESGMPRKPAVVPHHHIAAPFFKLKKLRQGPARGVEVPAAVRE